MTSRFADLKKIPKEPARRLLALGNARLATPLESPAAAPIDVVLGELAEKGGQFDMIRLLAAALPPRECIWWGCLAASDLVPEGAPVPPTLAAARAWVLKPTDETREAARRAAESAEPSEDTTLCANAVAMCDGKLGTGDMAKLAAPAGAVGTFMFGMNLISLNAAPPAEFEAHRELLIDRALDIARGGNGQIARAPKPEGIAP